MQEGPVRRRYRIPDMNIAGNIRQTHASLDKHVPWSKVYKNQLEWLKLMECLHREVSLCKLVYNGESVLRMGAVMSVQ